MRVPKIRQDFGDELDRKPENCDPCRLGVSGIGGQEPECLLPLVCIHLGSTPCVRGVTETFACPCFGGIFAASCA